MKIGLRLEAEFACQSAPGGGIHGHAVALYFAYYNFCRVHQTLRVTPAMEAGLANHVWSIEELIKLMEPKSILDGLQQAS
jgi:hypothetical protein